MTADLTVARDFDLGMTGPPLSLLDGLHRQRSGRHDRRPGCGGRPLRVCLVGAIVLAGAWLATHWLLRESAVWHDRNTDEVRARAARRRYAYRLAVDPPASKELRLFGLVGWAIERFVAGARGLHELQYEATRLRERPLVWSLLLVMAANVLVFWALARRSSGDASTSAKSWSTPSAWSARR